MTQPLFRAIDPTAAATIGFGQLEAIRSSVLTGFFAVCVGIIGAYAATGTYARKQSTTGTLVTLAGTVRAAPPRTGLLTGLFVANGDHVNGGEALFAVDYRQALESGTTLDTAVGAALDRQEALLRDQLASEEARAISEQAQAGSRIVALGSERDALASQREILERRVRMARNRFDAVAGLRSHGLVTENDFRAREDNWLAHSQELRAIDQRLIGITSEAQQAVSHRDQLPGNSSDRLARLRTGIAELQQRQAEAAAQGAQIVRASVAGRVTALQATVGQRVEPTKPVLALVPEAGEMHAEIFVPSRAIGFVRPGQAVRLKYDACVSAWKRGSDSLSVQFGCRQVRLEL